ncbi:MAG: hypothetical protein O2954_16625, partial [bacterium]|nr:hypothetical protein [bacterium]
NSWCPVCGNRLMMGVLHRVEMLTDRPEGAKPEGLRPFETLIPLSEVIGSVLGVGPTSKRVQGVYHNLLAELGPELYILREAPVQDIARCGEALVAEGVRRMRLGEVKLRRGTMACLGEFGYFRRRNRRS